MTFDEKTKARAAREEIPIPTGFDERMDARLRDLPAVSAAPRGTRRPVRMAACVGIAAALVVGAAAAAPALLQMTQGELGFFGGAASSQYGTQGAYERFNAAVGASQTVDGRTLTIDNVAVDDNYLSVFFTLTGETPIAMENEENYPESWIAQWSAPVFWMKVDGKELDTSGTVESQAYFAGENTLKGMRRLPLRDTLPDTFDLLLYTGDTSSESGAEFRFALGIDKSAVETRTVEPEQDFMVRYSGTDEAGNPYKVDCKPRIERVSVSPLSAAILLSQQTHGEEMPWDSFVLRDDKGNFLPRVNGGMVGQSFGRSRNLFEFIGADENTKSVTLIPVNWLAHAHEVEGSLDNLPLTDQSSHEVKGSLDSLPLTDESTSGLTLETLDIGEHRATATFSLRGAIWSENGQFTLIDADGNDLFSGFDSYADSYLDRESGRIVSTLEYPDATADVLAKVAGVRFWQPDDTMVLLEEQAVTIPLP